MWGLVSVASVSLMTRFYTIGLIFICLVSTALAQNQSRHNCLSYEPVIVKLTGTIISRTFPGPPNYESIREGDEPETYWLLRLPGPVCVDQRPGDLTDVAKKDIRRIQLVFDSEKAYKTYRRFLGRHVVATGTLYGSHTGHHKTPVLLRVFSLEKVR